MKIRYTPLTPMRTRHIYSTCCYVRWLFMFEAATSCAHKIKRTAIVLRSCHKTRLFDLSLRPSIDIKHLWVKRFFVVIAPTGKNWGNLTRKRRVLGRSPPSKSFPLEHHHRTSRDLQISRHLLIDSSTLEQSTSLCRVYTHQSTPA